MCPADAFVFESRQAAIGRQAAKDVITGADRAAGLVEYNQQMPKPGLTGRQFTRELLPTGNRRQISRGGEFR
jgi:hypothetical protein